MNKLTASLIGVGALISGCAALGTPTRHPVPEQEGVHAPVDQNRNGVPDGLERKAVPLEPVIDRAGKTSG